MHWFAYYITLIYIYVFETYTCAEMYSLFHYSTFFENLPTWLSLHLNPKLREVLEFYLIQDCA